jgi:hypothetical protein
MDANLPIYELKEASGVNGIVEQKGHRFNFVGWPLPSYRPVNDAAREVFDYYMRVRGTGECPDTPMRGGRIHLPPLACDLVPRYVVAVQKAGSGVIYSSAIYAAHGASIPPGCVYDTIAWPTPDMQPRNDAARAVHEYWSEHKDNPNLPREAWDVERQCVRTIPDAAAA